MLMHFKGPVDVGSCSIWRFFAAFSAARVVSSSTRLSNSSVAAHAQDASAPKTLICTSFFAVTSPTTSPSPAQATPVRPPTRCSDQQRARWVQWGGGRLQQGAKGQKWFRGRLGVQAHWPTPPPADPVPGKQPPPAPPYRDARCEQLRGLRGALLLL
eukprot:CAMPEP_0169475102 /NCGR_PEP_ID=MMETSP1042-20121227/26627_1 /TAXON_ID=464988 /ORGANISM="Hemiselmis andersenii, Strain CCMP1180" /LENGTH=156 /DNA_ID=CAMNT_0009589209 /DNA_START=234 /DNA_END=701 /DNA_ORIENTATION=+